MGHSTRHSLDANEFQGFAVSDPYAPVVFINDTDARAAQIFTLAHELAHIWIGATGISNCGVSRLQPRGLQVVDADSGSTKRSLDTAGTNPEVPG